MFSNSWLSNADVQTNTSVGEHCISPNTDTKDADDEDNTIQIQTQPAPFDSALENMREHEGVCMF